MIEIIHNYHCEYKELIREYWTAEQLILLLFLTSQLYSEQSYISSQMETTYGNSSFFLALVSPLLSTSVFDILVPWPYLCHVTFTHPQPFFCSASFHLDFHFAVTNEVTQAGVFAGELADGTVHSLQGRLSLMEVNDWERKSSRRSSRGWGGGALSLQVGAAQRRCSSKH